MDKLVFFTVVMLCAAFAPAGAEETPEVLVEVDRSQVYEGESLMYQVTLNHVEAPTPPVLEGFDDFLVTPAGEQSLNSTQVTIINGRRTRVVKMGMAYFYQLTPRKSGFLTIPAPYAEIEGEILRGSAITVKVIAPEEQEYAILELSTDKDRVYPLQPFTLSLKIFIKELPDPVQDRTPVSVQRSPFDLTIPFADRIPEGLEPTTDLKSWLSSKVAPSRSFFEQGNGFSINRSGSSFLPDQSRVTRQDSQGREQPYWCYTLERTFTPRTSGSFTFNPATLKGPLAIRVENGRLVGDEVYALSNTLTITVKDVPVEDRPASYTGAVGSFTLGADLVPRRARVGDPLTLTITLRGKGNLDRARAPDLERIPEFTDRFKIYEATEETKGYSRIFTYSLRPMDPTIESLPPVPLAYFDVDRERFVTLTTPPIPLQVAEADQLSEADIVKQPGQQQPTGNQIESRKEGIFANITDLDRVRDESVRPLFYGTCLGGMALFYLVFAMALSRVRRVSGDAALQRRRGARGKALGRVRQGMAAIEAGETQQGSELCRSALAGLVADAADLPEAGLSQREILGQLERFAVDPELRKKAGELLEAWDGLRFGAQDGLDPRLAEESQTVLEDLVMAFKKQGRLK